MMTRVAVIGCGGIAQGHHLPNIAASDHLELHVTCDLDGHVAESSARQFGAARSTSDWRAVMADDAVDMLLLATHTDFRIEPICEAIARRLPVYTEKPVANSVQALNDICQLSRKASVPICVGYNRRSSPALKLLRQLVAAAQTQGAEPAYFQRCHASQTNIPEQARTEILIRVNDDPRTWKPWSFEDSNGPFYNCTGHMLDVAMQLISSPPVKVFAHGGHRGNFTQLVAFADGSRLTLHYTVCGNFGWPKELYEITTRNVFISCDNFCEVKQVGLSGFAETTHFPLDYGNELTTRGGSQGYREAVQRFSEPAFDRTAVDYPYIWPDKGHRQHLEQFAAHIQGECENPFPVADAYNLTQLLRRLVESRQRSAWLPVTIPTMMTKEKCYAL